jgi:hypothetical protein
MKLFTAALAGGISLLALMPAVPALAATAAKPATTAAAAPAAAPALDPAAKAALDRMGTYLRTQKTFSVKVYSSTEDVLDNDQKIMTGNQVSYVVQAPNKLYAEVSADGDRHRFYYYDGMAFTVRGSADKYYATAPFTGTIGELLTKLDEKYGIEMPLQDLFRWGNPALETGHPTAGMLIGTSMVGEWKTDHYAFRQGNTDFQVWIEKGDKPLPRKIVIANLGDPTQPEYIALLDWNLTPDIAAGQFTYTPGPDSHKIPFMADAAAPKPAAPAK